MSPRWTHTVVVCCNERAGRPCCGREAGEALRNALRDAARAAGLRKSLVVHRGSCMDVCGPGTTVAVHGPEGRRVWTIRPDETDALCAELVRTVTHTRS